jgi:hypothetical protein
MGVNMTKKTAIIRVKKAKVESKEVTIFQGDDMRLVNSLLEEKLAENVFSVYRHSQRPNTLKRQHNDLVSFSQYLERAGLRRSVEDLENNPKSWEGIGKGMRSGQ